MIPTILILVAVAALWAVFSARLSGWHLKAPTILVLAGIATGLFTHHQLAVALNSTVAQHVAEVILAILLFVDATEIPRGRLWGGDPRSVARLLLIALPVAIVLTVLAGWFLLPDVGWAALLLIACVITPIDFAPAEWIVRERAVPGRVRRALNLESGYNDGIVSPLFLFALVLAGTSSARTPLEALATAVPSAAKAIVVGAVAGAVMALLMNVALSRGWMNDQAQRIAVVLVPLLAYVATVSVDGNGFVAAFVSGITFRFLRQRGVGEGGGLPHPSPAFSTQLRLVEDVSSLLTMAMWFVFGNMAVLVVSGGVDWRVLLLALLSLTVLRLLPVLGAFVRSRFSMRDRVMLGLLGPRGTTSIVFGLLAFNGLPDGFLADTALAVTVLTVLGSVLLHGFLAPVVPALRRRRAAAPAS